MDPEGKVALVTGGASGIGFALVTELLKNGANVAICDMDRELGMKSLKEITELFGDGRALFIEMDVTKDVEFEDAFETTKNHFKRMDIVVNNAGTLAGSNWERTVDVNVNGVIRGTLLALKYMGKDNGGNGGVIVNIASSVALKGFHLMPIYSATKQAVLGLTTCFGMPFHYDRTGVRAVTLCPGGTKTNLAMNYRQGLLVPAWGDILGDLKNLVTPDVVARSILHLIREAESGSVWVSEFDETYRVELPDREAMRVMS